MPSNKVTSKNCLFENRPDLAKEWNFKKNKLSSKQVACNSRKLVWWKCSKCNFEWQANIVDRNRYKYSGQVNRKRITKHPSFCPYCVSEIVTNKRLMLEWDFAKNKIHPCLVESNTKKYWWICKKCGNKYIAWIRNRLKGTSNCPYCNSLFYKFPELAKEFSSKNDISSKQVSYGSKKKYLWKCSNCENEWRASVSSRTNMGVKCPKCQQVKLKDGMVFQSKTEAYYYLILKRKKKKFLYNKKYGRNFGNRRYDFYLIDENKYIEVTSFHKKSKNINYFQYLKNIVLKKKYVRNILKANFEFVKIVMDKQKMKYLNSYI